MWTWFLYLLLCFRWIEKKKKKLEKVSFPGFDPSAGPHFCSLCCVLMFAAALSRPWSCGVDRMWCRIHSSPQRQRDTALKVTVSVISGPIPAISLLWFSQHGPWTETASICGSQQIHSPGVDVTTTIESETEGKLICSLSIVSYKIFELAVTEKQRKKTKNTEPVPHISSP